MAATTSKATEEGRRAKAEGASAESNPYAAGSEESADWLEGFTAGETPMNTDVEDEA